MRAAVGSTPIHSRLLLLNFEKDWEKMLPSDYDQYTPVINRFFRIETTTWGDEKKGLMVRYAGQLYNQDSAVAYDQLTQALQPLSVTPIFRIEENKQVIYLIKEILKPKPTKIWPNIVFFILTVVSVAFTGALFSASSFPTNLAGWINFLAGGLPFAIALMAILVCHEFGHYLVGRFHKTAVTLPFFIPFPFSYFGTMGAFIQLKEPPKNRRILLDIGLAGPLAGLLIAIPVLLIGLYLSPVDRLPIVLPVGQIFEGNSILYLLLKFIIKGQLLPQPFTFTGLSPIFYWIRYFFTGLPLPAGGLDVTLHPIAWAGWAGLLVTSLNLIPAGQLDGGHIMYVLLGKYTNRLLPIILAALVLLGFVWNGWWLWAALIFLLGRSHAEPLDQITQLDPKRQALALLGIIVFILVFMPVPLT
ncbi:MAG TPA: site-2 protease family protein [Anaerolineales bacterium]|nr:site-2 protease family protein [Anaerolineales bacterium]